MTYDGFYISDVPTSFSGFCIRTRFSDITDEEFGKLVTVWRHHIPTQRLFLQRPTDQSQCKNSKIFVVHGETTCDNGKLSREDYAFMRGIINGFIEALRLK